MRKKLLGIFLAIFMVILVTPIASKALGWKQIDGDWYYEESEGVYKTGWYLDDNNNWYYFNSEGKMQTGLQYIKGKYYYLAENEDLIGIMQTGWMKINEYWYYFSLDDGAAKDADWLSWSTGMYYFNDDGKMLTGPSIAHHEGSGDLYYFSQSTPLNQSFNVTYHIQTQADLNNYLASTGKNMLGDRVYFENTADLVFPENQVYYFTYDDATINSMYTYWYIMPTSTGNIDFNSSVFVIGEGSTLYLNSTGNHNNQEISKAKFFGSVSDEIITDGNNVRIKTKRGNFNADLIKASNMTFSDLIFINAHDTDDHIFDVMGCNNITFDYITSLGYFGDHTISELSEVFNNYSYFTMAKEVIQLDSALENASGISSSELSNHPVFSEITFDGTPSSYITITNGYFGHYKGSSGQAIIDRLNTTVFRPYGATIGSHSAGNSGYSHITITDNFFENTIYMPKEYAIATVGGISNYVPKFLYPIHIQDENPSDNITIQNNHFTNQYNGYGTIEYEDYGVELYGHTGYYGTTYPGTDGNIIQTDPNWNDMNYPSDSEKAKIERDIYNNGIMLTGWQTIDGDLYYFRKSDNDISEGYMGSAIEDECVEIDGENYCFNHFGVVYTPTTVIDVPTTAMCNNAVYNGEEQSIVNAAGTGYEWAYGTDLRTTPGQYTVTAKTLEGYEWTDYDGNGIERYITCTMSNAKVAEPVLTQSEYVFNGQTQYPVFSGFDENKMQFSVGSLGASAVGQYTTTIELLPYYEWEDGTTAAISYVWNIIKADFISPTIESYSGVYDGQPHTFTASHPWDDPREHIQYVVELEYSYDQSTWFSEKPTRTEIGTTTVYVRAKENSMYNASESVTATITITSTSIDAPTTDMCSNAVYNGEEQSITLTNQVGYTWSNNLKTNAGEYTVTATLSNGFSWSDGSSTNEKYITCSIARASVAKPVLEQSDYPMTGQTINPVFSGFDENKMQIVSGITGATNIGEYELTIEPKYNYQWTDGTTTAEVYVWRVVRFDPVPPVVENYSGVYDGQPHTFTVSHPYDDPREHIQYFVEMEYSYDQSTWFDEKPTRTEVGTTTVYVRAKQSDSFNASEAVTATITINNDDSTINGWYDDGTNKYYYVNGLPVTGLFTDTDGRIYYFNEDDNLGNMLVGRRAVNNQVYYFAEADDNANDIKQGEAILGWKEIDGNTYYFRTSENFPNNGPKGSGTIGFANIDSETYYFRESNQNPAGGPNATMVEGLAIINENKYYFRTTADEVSTGSKGSMLKDACVTVDNGYYCFDENGTLESQVITVTKPTTDRCISGIVYDGTMKELILNPVGDEGYTWSNYGQTNAGEHVVTATLNEDYKWNDDSTDPVEITCSISKKQLEKPVMNVSSFNYSGYQITPIIDSFNSFIMNIDGDESATDVGEYSSTVSLKFPVNYEWDDGTQTNIAFVWTINKVDYSAPTVTPYFNKYDGDEHTVQATGDGTLEYSEDNILWSDEAPLYTNAGVYPVYVRVKADDNHNASQVVESSVTINKIVVNYPTLSTTLYNYTGEVITPELTGVDTDLMTVSAETFGTNAGEYSIFVSLNDRVNTVWEDDSDSSYTITWRIAKISGDTPTVMPYSNVYDKQPHSIEALGGELEYSLDDTNWSDEKPTRTDVGSTTVYVRTKGDDNHNPSASVNSTITITKRSLIKPTMTTSNYLFTGSEINFSINFYNDNWSDWMEKAGTYTATTVGSYVAEVALLDTNNTEWNDHTTTNVSFNWSIVQSQSNVPVITNYVGTYDGEPHSITVAPTSYGTLFYSTNYNIPGVDAVWSTVNPTRTNVGTTNVYVYIRGDANHTDSPVVMGSITITDAIPDYQIDNYSVDEVNKYIKGITVGTELSDFISNFTLGTGYSVVVDTKSVNGKEVLYTGGKTKILQGNAVVAEFTNVVIGDVNGNGMIDIIDYIRIMKDIMDTEKLSGAYALAADVNGNSEIDIIDYIRIMKIIMEEE